MRKNIKKFVISLFAFLLFITVLFNNYNVNATGFSKAPLSGFDNTRDGLELGEVTGTMDNLTATIMTIARTVSVAIAIVMLLVIGMKYMISSPGDRADIKKHAIAYVVGAFILFGVSGILTILLTFAEKIGS